MYRKLAEPRLWQFFITPEPLKEGECDEKGPQSEAPHSPEGLRFKIMFTRITVAEFVGFFSMFAFLFSRNRSASRFRQEPRRSPLCKMPFLSSPHCAGHRPRVPRSCESRPLFPPCTGSRGSNGLSRGCRRIRSPHRRNICPYAPSREVPELSDPDSGRT
jgi:hypothetical protein